MADNNKSWEIKVLETFECLKSNPWWILFKTLFAIGFLLCLAIVLLSPNDTLQNNQLQEQNTVKQEIQQIETKAVLKLSKDECYQLEQGLWGRNRKKFVDNSEYINVNYDRYNKGCSEFKAQTATWKPDYNWFLFHNYYLLAKDYFDLKDYAKAVIFYDISIQEINKSAFSLNQGLAYYEGGQSHYYLGNYEKAKEYLLNASEKFLLVLEYLADIYYIEGDYKSAIHYYEKCLNYVDNDLEKNANGEYLRPLDMGTLEYLAGKRSKYFQKIQELEKMDY